MKQLTLNTENEERLFEEISSERQLRQAFRAVKRNGGSPGVDGVTVETFEEDLEEELSRLTNELRTWTYEVRPVRRVRIPKPDGGERLLGVPCVRDRVVQSAMKMSLEGRFEAVFSETSYGFRPRRSQEQALHKAKQYVQSGKPWVVDIDLEKFFDTINHDRLVMLVGKKVKDRRILRLIGMTLRSGICEGSDYEPSTEGAPQGSPLSPLLSNIVLDELDKELERRGLAYCRFADDCNIYLGSEKAAQRVMRSITAFIEKKLKLKVNRQKSKVGKAEAIKFLGITIKRGKFVISSKALARAAVTVRALTPRRTHIPFEKQIARINRWYRGWSNYFGITERRNQLHVIEAHIRRRLRVQLLRNQKNRRALYRKYRQQGLSDHRARAAYSRVGWWGLSRTGAAERVWSNEWFRYQGLYTLETPRPYPHTRKNVQVRFV